MLGNMLHDMIYPYVFIPGGVGAVKTGANLDSQRLAVARQGRKDTYRRVLELGFGTGRFLSALQQTYPDTQVVGVELAESLCRYAHFLAGESGYSWELRQAPAEDTGFASDELRSGHRVHAVPRSTFSQPLGRSCARRTASSNRWRIRHRRRGAVLGSQDPFQTLVMDWETENRNEPFWRGALLIDRAKLLSEAGFVEVEEFGVDGGNYPWVTRGPASCATVCSPTWRRANQIGNPGAPEGHICSPPARCRLLAI